MKNNRFISIEDVSDLCEIEIAVLKEWVEDGLISVRIEGHTECVESDELRAIGRIVVMHKALGVNKEGLGIILAMRNRIAEMSEELAALQHRLVRLENERKLRSLDIPGEMGLIVDYFESDEE